MNNPSSLSHVEAAAIVKDWANRCGHIDAETLRLPLGLTAAEWEAASFFYRVIPQVALPPELEEQVGWYQSGYYRSDFQLTEQEKALLQELPWETSVLLPRFTASQRHAQKQVCPRFA